MKEEEAAGEERKNSVNQGKKSSGLNYVRDTVDRLEQGFEENRD